MLLFTLTSRTPGMAKASLAPRMTRGTNVESFIVRAWVLK